MSVLIIAEHDNKELNQLTLNAVTAARELSDNISMFVAGSECHDVVSQCCKIEGLSTVLVCDSPHYDNAMAENTANLLASIVEEFDHILATSTTSSKNIMPRLAAHIDVQAISDVSAIIDESTFKRPIYAGNVIATIKSSDVKKVITIRSTAFDAAKNEGGSAEVVNIDASSDLSLIHI